MRKRPLRLSTTVAFLLVSGGFTPVHAQQSSASEDDRNEIVVVAERPRGTVVTTIVPVEELNEEDIASFGASSIQDLVGALTSSTSSGRGRGSGRPIVLINGQRTSGFREIRDLPPEAISNVQVFPEELALQYGYRPDQRVINFVLKEGYFGISAEAQYGVPTQGDQGQAELESTLTQIGKNSRLNVNIEYNNKTAITEAERGIIQDMVGDIVDLGNFRTLSAPSDNLELNAVYSRTFGDGTLLSLNGGYVYEKTRRLLGLPSGILTDPSDGSQQFRYFTQFGPLQRPVETNTAQFGITLNGKIANWRYSLTTDYKREQVNTLTDRSGDIRALQTAIDAGSVDIFASDFGPLLDAPTTDRARVVDQTINGLATLSGTLFILPSGAVTTTLRGGYRRRDLDSQDMIGGATTRSGLVRDNINAGINIDIPLADENMGVSDTIGKLSINGNVGYSQLSDFGGLVEFGFGLNWEPFVGFSVSASAIGEEAAPGIGQLGNPLIVTPNVNVFDFTNGQSVLATITSGGNLNLPTEKRRDIKLAVNYRPEWLDGMTFLAEYFRNNSDNVLSSFPALTPEIEAAFPGRVTRDAAGTLIAIDRRSVGFSNIFSEHIRYGLSFRKRFGRRRGRGGARGRGGRPDRSKGADTGSQRRNSTEVLSTKRPNGIQGEGARDTGGGARSPADARAERRAAASDARQGGVRRRGNRRRGGRWGVSAYHTIRFQDRILIRRGVEELDLLNGSATGSNGGRPRHEFELSGGWFNNGLGFRLRGKHQSATRVNGGLTGSDLRFSDLSTLNLRVFVNFDDRGKLTEKFKFLKGSRVALRINNIFNDIQDIRDASGMVPLRFQPGFVDPVGRYIEVSFRKRF